MLTTLPLLVSLLLPAAPAEKAAIRLTDQVDGSSFACIGRVEQIVPVTLPGYFGDFGSVFEYGPPTQYEYAKVRVERVLKGDRNASTVTVEAFTTWTCDTTRCTVGERALFLLASNEPKTPPSVSTCVRQPSTRSLVSRAEG